MGIRYTLRKATQSLRFSSVIPACGNDWTTVFMIHKRELSDSMIESGSSLFYLFHCSAHDRLNTMPFRLFRNTPHGLHPSTRTPKSTPTTLPQHTPHGLHRNWHAGRRWAGSFASAHPARIASHVIVVCFPDVGLCLSTPRTDCISKIAQMQCHKSTQYAVSW